MTNQDVKTEIRVVTRLSGEEYQKIEKKLGHIQVGPDTSPIQVGYMLGVQAALKVLREGFVYGDITAART